MTKREHKTYDQQSMTNRGIEVVLYDNQISLWSRIRLSGTWALDGRGGAEGGYSPGCLWKCGTGWGHIQKRQQSSSCWWPRMACCGGQGRLAGGALGTGGHTASHVTLPYSQKQRCSQPVTCQPTGSIAFTGLRGRGAGAGRQPAEHACVALPTLAGISLKLGKRWSRYTQDPLLRHDTFSGQQWGGCATKFRGTVSQSRHSGSSRSKPKSVGHSSGAHCIPVWVHAQNAWQPSWNSSSGTHSNQLHSSSSLSHIHIDIHCELHL